MPPTLLLDRWVDTAVRLHNAKRSYTPRFGDEQTATIAILRAQQRWHGRWLRLAHATCDADAVHRHGRAVFRIGARISSYERRTRCAKVLQRSWRSRPSLPTHPRHTNKASGKAALLLVTEDDDFDMLPMCKRLNERLFLFQLRKNRISSRLATVLVDQCDRRPAISRFFDFETGSTWRWHPFFTQTPPRKRDMP